MTTFLQKLAGKTGKVIDILGSNPVVRTVTGLSKIPEMNISERLQSYGGQVNPFNPPKVSAGEQINWGPSQDNASWNQPTPQVLGTQTGGSNYNTSGTTSGQNIIEQNASDQNNNIDQDYENTMTMLGGQEQQAMGQAAEATGTLGSESTQVKNQLANQQAVETQGNEAQLATGEKTAATGLQGARDLFRQTQQNQIAQLSGAGLSSSSVAEALAERLGVETARRIAGITGSLGEVRQNAAKEIARIKNYYEGKATEVTQWIGNEKIKIQNALNAQLNQINNARNQAAQAKSQARESLLADVRNQMYTLQQQENKYQQSLKLWAAQKAAATQQLITDPTIWQNIQNTLTANVNSATSPVTTTPTWAVNPSGQVGIVPGAFKTTTKKTGSGIIDPITGEEV